MGSIRMTPRRLREPRTKKVCCQTLRTRRGPRSNACMDAPERTILGDNSLLPVFPSFLVSSWHVVIGGHLYDMYDFLRAGFHLLAAVRHRVLEQNRQGRRKDERKKNVPNSETVGPV